MESKLNSGLAVAAGTGLAIGLGFVCLVPGKRRRRTVRINTPPADSILLLEPVLNRLDRIEARVRAVESRPASPADSASSGETEKRFQRQAKEIEVLQAQMSETSQRVAAEALMAERRFAELAKEDPAILETMLDTTISLRAEDIRVRLQTEMLQSVEATLSKFERTIDGKVSARIATIEKALADQSAVITALSQREIESDADLQRLVSAVERLCDRTEGNSALLDQPLDRHFSGLRENGTRETQPEPVVRH